MPAQLVIILLAQPIAMLLFIDLLDFVTAEHPCDSLLTHGHPTQLSHVQGLPAPLGYE